MYNCINTRSSCTGSRAAALLRAPVRVAALVLSACGGRRQATGTRGGQEPGRRRRSRVRFLAALGLAAVLLVVLAGDLAEPLQAQAPTVTTFVSNTGQDRSTSNLHVSHRSGIAITQGFRTGSNADGYTLNAIGIFVESSSIANSGEVTANIHAEAVGGGPAAAVLYELTTPWPITANAVNDFLAPANATLAADTNYFVAFTGTKTLFDFAFFVEITDSDSDDSGAADNWSIEDGYRSSGTLTTRAAMISVKGTVVGGTTLSTDATLSDLELEDASDDSAITLTPSTFVATTTSYTADVANGVDEITIKPTVNESNATFKILDASDTELTDADAVQDDFQVALSVGENTIKVEVTAEDTTTMETYTVVVTQAMPATPTVSISADKMSAVFKEDGITYTLTRSGLTTVAVPVTVTLTQDEGIPAGGGSLTQTVTIPAGQSMEDLHGRGLQLPAVRGGNDGRGRDSHRSGAGRFSTTTWGRRPRSMCPSSSARYGLDRVSVLHRGRGGRHPHGQADCAHGPGRAAADFDHQLTVLCCRLIKLLSTCHRLRLFKTPRTSF